MKYTQNREVNTLTVTFKMDAAEWAVYDRKAYDQNKGKYNVPGFRKGHVPKHVLHLIPNFWIKIKRSNPFPVRLSTKNL